MLIGVLIVYGNFIRPAYDNTIKLRSELAVQTKTLAEQENAVKQVQTLISQFESIARLQDAISLALPLSESVPQSLVQYGALAQLSNVAIKDVSLQYLAIEKTSKKSSLSLVKGVGKLRFDLNIAGEYEALKGFVDNLEKSIRLSDIVSLKLDKAGEVEKKSHSLHLTVDNYYQTR